MFQKHSNYRYLPPLGGEGVKVYTLKRYQISGQHKVQANDRKFKLPEVLKESPKNYELNNSLREQQLRLIMTDKADKWLRERDRISPNRSNPKD